MANFCGSESTPYSSRQRAVGLSLGVAFSIPVTSSVAMANVPVPTTSFAPVTHFTAPSSGHHQTTGFVHGSPMTLHAPVAPGGAVNLASSTLSYLAGNLANFSSLTIDVGGHQEQVGLNTKLTAAEVVAAEQVITGGGASAQTLKIGANGVATGGTVTLNNGLLTALDNSVGGSISSVTIAKHVEVIDSVGQLSLSGNLANYGSLLTASGGSGNSDTISANSILNAGGASIGSYLGGGGMVGANPVLSAATSITNNGSISSAGNLTLSAPTVTNAGSGGSTASIGAANNVNINTANLTNSGAIAALTGNVNVASNGALAFNGVGGTIQANNGNINLSSTDADINAFGGNMLSQQLNFNAGTGNVLGQLDQVTGVVNANANCVHLGANTSTLDLGAIDATGDPTITNTGVLAISASGASFPGQALTLIAGGNIVTDTPNIGIDTTGVTGNNLTLIAGAAFTPFTSGTQAGSTTVTKASATGGIIDLTGGNGGSGAIASINTAGTGPNANGGNVEMVAFAGKAAGSGAVITPAAVPINAAGSGTGISGNVTIIAGAKTGQAVTTGEIFANAVTVSAAAPTIIPQKGTTGVVFASSGLVSTGSFGPSKTANVASISLGNVVRGTVADTGNLTITTASGASVTDTGTGALNLGAITVGVKTGSFVASNAGSDINLAGVVSGGSASLTTTGPGLITGNVSPASINTTSLALSAGSGNINVNTDVGTLTFATTSGSVTVHQAGPKTTLAMGVSGKIQTAGTGSVAVTSAGQITVNGLLAANNSSVSLTATGSGGISIASAIQVGTGSITLTSSGKGLLTETPGNVVTGGTVTLNTTTVNTGSKTLPFFTNATNLAINAAGAKAITYVTDQQTNVLSVSGNKAALAAGGSLFLVSDSINGLNVDTLQYNNVSVTNNIGTAVVTLVKNATIGSLTGAGTVTIVSADAITAATGTSVNGTTVTLTGITGVGTNAQNIDVMSPNLVLNAANGSVFVTDSSAATVNGAASLNGKAEFTVMDIAAGNLKTGDSLTVGKSVGGGNITLTTTNGALALNGTTGTINSGNVVLTSAKGMTTKGAINGATIDLTAQGGVLTVGGAIGGLGTTLDLQTTGAATDTMVIGGVLTGHQITVDSISTVTTTKAITGVGSGSTVTITGAGSATSNAMTIGGAVGGLFITLELDGGAIGNIAANAAIGGASTFSTGIFTTTGAAAGGAITGKGVIGGEQVVLDATAGIGTLKAPILTAAVNLALNTGGANVGGSFITQKGNLGVDTVNTDSLTMKVTGTTDLSGPIVVPAISIISSGAMTIDGSVSTGPSTTSTVTLTSGGNFTTAATGLLASLEPVTIKVTGAGNINGTFNITALTLTTTGNLTIGTGATVNDVADNINAKGAFTVNGALGNAADKLTLVSAGAFTIGNPAAAASVTGVGTINALTIANYNTAAGNITYTATGTGNAFSNFGTIGNAADTDAITISAAKGSITSAAGSVINAATLSLTAGANASVNLGGTAATDLTGATVKSALVINSTNGTNLTLGGLVAGSITAGSLNATYANGTAKNTNTLTVNDIATSTGDLTISSNAEFIAVGPAASLTTLAGNINIQNTNGNNPGAKITFGDGAIVHASGAKTNLNQGNVSIFMGPSGYTPAVSSTALPAGVTVGPPPPAVAQVFLASTANPANTITVTGTGNTLTGSGRNLSLNVASYGNGAISLGNNVAITADPPAGGAPGAQALANNVAAVVVPAFANNALTNASAATGLTPPIVGSTNFGGTSLAGINNAAVAAVSAGNFGSIYGVTASDLDDATIQNGIGMAYAEASRSAGASSTTSVGLVRKLTGEVSNTVHKTLNHGPLLLLPERNTVVDTPFGSVRVAAGSVALIVSSDSGLAVYNLHDAHSNAVVVSGGGDTVAVSPGRTALLTNASAPSFEAVNPAPIVGYRRITSKDIDGHGRLYQAEFEIMSMVQGQPAIRQLLHADNAKTRKTMDQMIKTSVILWQLSQSGEQYKMYVPAKIATLLSSANR